MGLWQFVRRPAGVALTALLGSGLVLAASASTVASASAKSPSQVAVAARAYDRTGYITARSGGYLVATSTAVGTKVLVQKKKPGRKWVVTHSGGQIHVRVPGTSACLADTSGGGRLRNCYVLNTWLNYNNTGAYQRVTRGEGVLTSPLKFGGQVGFPTHNVKNAHRREWRVP